jgi:hypothetical protein
VAINYLYKVRTEKSSLQSCTILKIGTAGLTPFLPEILFLTWSSWSRIETRTKKRTGKLSKGKTHNEQRQIIAVFTYFYSEVLIEITGKNVIKKQDSGWIRAWALPRCQKDLGSEAGSAEAVPAHQKKL